MTINDHWIFITFLIYHLLFYKSIPKGEVCSLAYAKVKGIPVFATDENDLQPIIDKQLNTGMDDITCVRIVDIIIKAREKEKFDAEIWPITTV